MPTDPALPAAARAERDLLIRMTRPTESVFGGFGLNEADAQKLIDAHAAEVRSAAFNEAADTTAAWAGDDTPMEDRPGYDGPVIDPEDRLRTAIDTEVPLSLRDQLIAEHRQMVTDEITAELRRLATTTPTRQEKPHGRA